MTTYEPEEYQKLLEENEKLLMAVGKWKEAHFNIEKEIKQLKRELATAKAENEKLKVESDFYYEIISEAVKPEWLIAQAKGMKEQANEWR